jgi:hypoxanthine-DNA glycosylase
VKRSFPPLAGDDVTILILGSLPGERSLAMNEYYAHPRNRFWPLLATLAGQPLPDSYPGKAALLALAGIGLWDVVRAARREGSLDSAIREEQPNDIPAFIATHPRLRLVAFNGKTAATLFHACFREHPGILYRTLPSTSPANATYNFDRLRDEWATALSPFMDRR